MKVREAVKVLRCAKSISVGFGETEVAIHPDNVLMMDAYGDYSVYEILSPGEEDYVIVITMQPVKE